VNWLDQKITKILDFLLQEVLTARQVSFYHCLSGGSTSASHQETEKAKVDKVSAEQSQVQAEASLTALRVVVDNVGGLIIKVIMSMTSHCTSSCRPGTQPLVAPCVTLPQTVLSRKWLPSINIILLTRCGACQGW
jgi:hypothetical protein